VIQQRMQKNMEAQEKLLMKRKIEEEEKLLFGFMLAFIFIP
jgi:hypothetical protein